MSKKKEEEFELLKHENKSMELIIQQLRENEGEVKAKNEEITHLKIAMQELKLNFNETLANNDYNIPPA